MGARPYEARDAVFPEVKDLADEVQSVFDELDRRHTATFRAAAGVYTPPLDVVESDSSFEIVVDLPGVAREGLHVVFKRGALIIVGAKRPPAPCDPKGHAYHLVERGFGRFARVVRLPGPIDGGRITARLAAGELRVLLPRIAERRGRDIVVTVEGTASDQRKAGAGTSS